MRTRALGFVVASAIAGTTLLGGATDRVLAEPVNCFGLAPTILATGSVTYGTTGPDVIIGTSDDDTIYGKGGNDYICDTEGVNVIHGEAGNDHINGTGTLFGETGNDEIVSNLLTQGVRGPATAIYGGANADNISGDNLSVVDGGAGNDTINVGSASRVLGGSGDDYIQVETAGEVNGGSEGDVIGVGKTELLDCGSGQDDFDVIVADIIRRCENEILS